MIVYYNTGFANQHACIKLEQKKNNIFLSEFQDTPFAVANKKETDVTFLLSEKNFSFYSFHLFFTFEEETTVAKINEIVDEKFIYIQEQHREEAEYSMIFIDNIFVNGESKQHILKHSGQVFFTLSFLFLKRDLLDAVHTRLGHLEEFGLSLLPKSLCTVNFVKDQLHKQSFYLLYIHQYYSKIIQIEHGTYKQIETVNIGINMLQDMYYDHQLMDLFYASKEQLEQKPMARQIMDQIVEFFTEMLAKWLREYITQQTDIILLSSLSKNIVFQEHFTKWYHYFINGYILPFNIDEKKIQTYDREWKKEEIDILLYLNGLDALKKRLWTY